MKLSSICLKKNSVKPHKISTHSAHSDNLYFYFFYLLSDWVEILWDCTNYLFQTDAESFGFLIEKKFYSWKKYNLGHSPKLKIGQESSNRRRFLSQFSVKVLMLAVSGVVGKKHIKQNENENICCQFVLYTGNS